ncbi:adapter protein MecA 1/2 [Halobacillus karajensis]|uniref:Adapter protein MecA n=1 Tax=Halobacillus karajensis TaxID=195088 RepID=A0A024P919_9BACI|nr:adaptor protein MecA [Halobacillus karajensis]CDQ21019.1 Adapter protein MecA 1 [Halobacillus karajensis]CDQ24917.1 Adapter protein MecA 1 [Halobacillus karajensis]CDQ28723.1 Adapter protein MecA 1 [Halobacillus karajensis]SEH97387.1 adapter protein MecA 1/2 [Halobacillus karajensis]
MEIERINENTVKFYVTYQDVEQRGFDREEIWYNRERSEQLFWEMMDEVNDQENFQADGPLWIQVQAMDKGLEVIVTKAQVSQDGQKLELPNEDGKAIDVPVDDKLESLLDDKFHASEDYDQRNDDDADQEDSDEPLTFTLKFNEFEDIIQLSHYLSSAESMEQRLFHFEDRYYLYIQFIDENMSDDEQENVLSQLMEYAQESSLTIHRLEEYGKTIFNDRALELVQEYFPVD